MEIFPVTLAGRHVRLEPLGLEHYDDLLRAARDPEIWRHISMNSLADPARMRAWIEAKKAERVAGTWLAFAIIDVATGRAVGSSSYMDISRSDRRLEIGSTWLAREVWRTAINTEGKFLLLRHAFESLGCLRVQFKTDIHNERSQRAIERIGAVREGVLRAHMARPDGSQRDSVMYSLIVSEWPTVKARLEGLLDR